MKVVKLPDMSVNANFDEDNVNSSRTLTMEFIGYYQTFACCSCPKILAVDDESHDGA